MGYVIRKIDQPTLGWLVEGDGMEALTGAAGTVALLHCNIVHGSGPNISPMSRTIFYLNYNACSNACAGLGVAGRGWWHCNTDSTALRALADDCLLPGTINNASSEGGTTNSKL